MVETNLKLEQKEKNKQYLLEHFEEYVLDEHENFVNVAPDTEGDEWFFYFPKDSLPPGTFEEFKTNLFEKILREIKDWELFFYKYETNYNDTIYFRHKRSKILIPRGAFDFEKSYKIIGELGYRKNI